MAGTESLNLPHPASRLPPADAQAAARRAGHLSWFVRLSLDEPEAMRRMQAMVGKLHDSSRLDALLPQVLDGALALTGADFGNVQLLDPASGALLIATQSGFGSEFTDYFAVVDDGHSACGRAARDCSQTVIADVTTDPGFAPHREIAAAAGFRAVQSTPLADSGGRLVGMVSTHWRRPGRPSGRDLRMLELFGDLAGEAVARRLGPASGPAVPRPARRAGDEPWYQPDGEPAPPATALEEFAGEVVRRLFAAGLSLASAQAIIGGGAAGDRVAAAVDELDSTIRDVRAMMLRGPGGLHRQPAFDDGAGGTLALSLAARRRGESGQMAVKPGQPQQAQHPRGHGDQPEPVRQVPDGPGGAGQHAEPGGVQERHPAEVDGYPGHGLAGRLGQQVPRYGRGDDVDLAGQGHHHVTSRHHGHFRTHGPPQDGAVAAPHRGQELPLQSGWRRVALHAFRRA